MESVLQLYGAAMVILPVVAFVSLRKSVRNGGVSKRGAMVRYAGVVVAPIVTRVTNCALCRRTNFRAV